MCVYIYLTFYYIIYFSSSQSPLKKLVQLQKKFRRARQAQLKDRLHARVFTVAPAATTGHHLQGEAQWSTDALDARAWPFP